MRSIDPASRPSTYHYEGRQAEPLLRSSSFIDLRPAYAQVRSCSMCFRATATVPGSCPILARGWHRLRSSAVRLRGGVRSRLIAGLVAIRVCLVPAPLLRADTQRSVTTFLPHVSEDVEIVLHIPAEFALRDICVFIRHLAPLATSHFEPHLMRLD